MTNFFELNKLTFIESGRSDTFILRSALTRKYIRKHVHYYSCSSVLFLFYRKTLGKPLTLEK